MVLRVDAVEIRLLRLEQVISELARLNEADPGQFRENPLEMWKVERGLQLGAEILLDIGNHILVAQYGVSSLEYRDIFERLADRKVLSRSVADRLSGLAGFRNILVHDYLDLNPEKVLENLRRAPRDFSEFAQEVRDWLGARSG
ncbi:MAG TPA: DUF86 domain-containing protein [Thermoanaerobaculia bacterium]|jgi:uncharacterized protein YutE (UPF0331/DUF86 family)